MKNNLELVDLSEKVLELLHKLYLQGDVTKAELIKHSEKKIEFLNKYKELV